MAGCDVAVVGAGVIGQAIAYELVTRGTSVTILDARGAGLGSTQAAAGMLVPYIEGVGHALLPLAAKSLDMYDAASDLVPEIWQAGFTAARVGLRPATPDQMPAIGRSSKVPGVVFATGHFRNGILLAPFTAKAVADLVLENREDPLLAAASPQRFGEY
jgi:glycine/D-amino acid oxidase-like deaminating enzyme